MLTCDLTQYHKLNEHVGRNKVIIHPTTSITQMSAAPDKNGKIYFWEDKNLNIDENSNLSIGKYCSIALGVEFFLGGNHRFDFITTALLDPKQPERIQSKGDICIGNDVWIGYQATVLSGTTIGDGAVIGAKSVVSGTIPPYAIIAGNPGNIIKYRFDQKTIDLLLTIKWWDWPQEKINRYRSLLCSSNFEMLQELHYSRS